jgi:hypothetical protein
MILIYFGGSIEGQGMGYPPDSPSEIPSVGVTWTGRTANGIVSRRGTVGLQSKEDMDRFCLGTVFAWFCTLLKYVYATAFPTRHAPFFWYVLVAGSFCVRCDTPVSISSYSEYRLWLESW